ncbi:MAG: hypothetical protein H7Z19_18310, partial [Chitinophagaceae bacterium]|nr:hypothetical protein [Rubrivivax sp.]
PRAVAQGQSAALAGWPVPLALDALQKLCHDSMARAVGAATCYFPGADVPASASLATLSDWAHDLARVARHAEHPWNEGLLVESLVQQGRRALASPSRPVDGRGAATLG